MSARRTEDVIAELADRLEPRPPLRHPAVRALLWLALAGAFVLAVALANGLRADLRSYFSASRALLEWLAALATAATAALAAFNLALPDRDPRWGLLPVPATVLWLATLGYGCFADLLAQGAQGLAIGTSPHCVKFIMLTSLPLVGSLFFLLRHAAAIRPGATAAAGALAAAALSSAGLTLFHDLDSAIMVLIWHGVPVALVAAGGSLLARPAFRLLAREI